MSIVSFIKEAGEKLFGHKEAAVAARQAQAAPDDDARLIAAETANQNAAGAIEKYIASLNLSAQGLLVAFDGASGTATVMGTAADQASKEKILLCCGNVHGVAQVNDMMTVLKPADASKFHTVAKGESLSAISKKYYDNATAYMRIFDANRPMLSHPDKIYPGQLLRIPT